MGKLRRNVGRGRVKLNHNQIMFFSHGKNQGKSILRRLGLIHHVVASVTALVAGYPQNQCTSHFHSSSSFLILLIVFCTNI